MFFSEQRGGVKINRSRVAQTQLAPRGLRRVIVVNIFTNNKQRTMFHNTVRFDFMKKPKIV